jgi:hypothetical protein
MRTFLGGVLGVIAVGVLLIAYGVFNPRTATADSSSQAQSIYGDRVGYAANQPLQRAVYSNDGSMAASPQLEIRCEAGQRAVIRQVNGAAAGECVDGGGYVNGPRAERAALTYPVYEQAPVRRVRTVSYQSAPRRTAARVERPGRDWAKTAMVIGGTSAAGAGIGAIFGGKKGALIGAAVGGGAGTLYEVKH